MHVVFGDVCIFERERRPSDGDGESHQADGNEAGQAARFGIAVMKVPHLNEESLPTPERGQQRRQFVDELKAHIPVHPITEITAEIIARVGGEQAAKGINLPFIDLITGACALELGYAM